MHRVDAVLGGPLRVFERADKIIALLDELARGILVVYQLDERGNLIELDFEQGRKRIELFLQRGEVPEDGLGLPLMAGRRKRDDLSRQ